MTHPNSHPMQPIITVDGVARFKENAIVRYLLDAGTIDLNQLAALPFSNEDRNQFAQLIGYSVGGFGDLPYADPKIVKKADKKAEKLLNDNQNRT